MKISATVITLNEERNIPDCLASLEFADEIVVVDSGSNDLTEELCRQNPKVRFFKQEWLGYGRQKNRAAELAVHDWILNLDADERVTPDLRQSIMQADLAKFSAARMARENYFGDRWVRYCGWYPDYTVRLYNRTACSFSEREVHESLEHSGRIETLAGNLKHLTYTGIPDYLRRMDRYSTLAAQELFKSSKKCGVITLLVKPVATFLKMYVVRSGYREGRLGLVLSLLYACYTFCKYAKLSELHDSNR